MMQAGPTALENSPKRSAERFPTSSTSKEENIFVRNLCAVGDLLNSTTMAGCNIEIRAVSFASTVPFARNSGPISEVATGHVFSLAHCSANLLFLLLVLSPQAGLPTMISHQR